MQTLFLFDSLKSKGDDYEFTFTKRNKLKSIKSKDKTLFTISYDKDGKVKTYNDNDGNWWDSKLCNYSFPFQSRFDSIKILKLEYKFKMKDADEYFEYHLSLRGKKKELSNIPTKESVIGVIVENGSVLACKRVKGRNVHYHGNIEVITATFVNMEFFSKSIPR